MSIYRLPCIKIIKYKYNTNKIINNFPNKQKENPHVWRPDNWEIYSFVLLIYIGASISLVSKNEWELLKENNASLTPSDIVAEAAN
jgi:hypothetical protein